MSLYKRGNIWWVELSSPQGRVRRSAETSDKKAAQEYHEKLKGEIWRQDKLGESPKVTWLAAVKKWMAVKERSQSDRYTIRALEIPPTMVLPLPEAYLTAQLTKNLTTVSPSSWNRYLSLVLAIHSCAGISASPIKRRPNPQGRTRWLTAEEWTKLRKSLSGLLLDLADFSIATGVRENNALGLRWDQILLSKRIAWFYGDQMKGKVPLGIPLNDDAMAVLRRRKGIHKVYVFPNPDTGLPLTRASNRAWYDALKASKLKGTGVVWHTLRHTWASWFVMNGGSLHELMALGGWKTYSMVLKYAHLAPGHLAEAAARVKPVSLRYNASRRGITPTA
jgi:integrase